MKKLTVIALLFLLGACSPAPKQDVFTELAQKRGYWKLAGGDVFSDGGSYCLSFISPDGRLLHVFVLADLRRKDGALIFELRRDYPDENSVVIVPESELEAQVLWLLQNYATRREIIMGREYAESMAYSLKHRREEFPFGEKFRKKLETASKEAEQKR